MSVRYAPSPTGVLHVGNLRTAWISHWWAQQLGQPWHVRFEDIDQPRVVVGAQHQQLSDLAALGLVPAKIYTQSAQHERHFQLFCQAVSAGRLYPCDCSRQDVRDDLAHAASAPHGALPIYSGRCRKGLTGAAKGTSLAWRWRDDTHTGGAHDFIIGRTVRGSDEPNFLPSASVDFTPAYHWACAIDDYDEKHLLLVRAVDLAESAPLQRKIIAWLQSILAPQAFPAVFHTALVAQDDGHRLEKRSRGVTLAELQMRGLSVDQLLECFRQSFFARPEDYTPEKIFGEPKTQLLLRDLRLPV